MRSSSTLFLAALVLASSAAAQSKKEDWPEGSANRTGMELSEKLDNSTRQLVAETSKLVDLVESNHMGIDLRLQDAVKQQGAAWIRFRADECYLAGAIVGGGGAWPVTHATECEVQLTELRVAAVMSAESCISALDADKRHYDGPSCLQALQSFLHTKPSR